MSIRNDDSPLASVMPTLLTLAYFALMGWVILAGGPR